MLTSTWRFVAWARASGPVRALLDSPCGPVPPRPGRDRPAYVRDATPLKFKGEITTQALRMEFRRNTKLSILVGNGVFLKGGRKGVQNKFFVYRSGDLIWGLGEPAVQIKIDEQSMVLTTGYAKKKGVWPRPEPAPPPRPEPPPPGKVPAFESEGILQEALLQVWEKAKANKDVKSLGEITIRIFEADVGFPLLRVAASVPKAQKAVVIELAYKSADGGELELRYTGPLSDVRPVTEFLDPQLRVATEPVTEIPLTLSFPDGLTLDGPDPAKLKERLSRFVSGEANVRAKALQEEE